MLDCFGFCGVIYGYTMVVSLGGDYNDHRRIFKRLWRCFALFNVVYNNLFLFFFGCRFGNWQDS